MNSNNIVNSVENLLSPIVTNKYVRATLLIILLVNTHYFVPQLLLPNSLTNTLKKYPILSFVFTFLLFYLLTTDINVSIVASLLIYALNYLNLKMEYFENTDATTLLINEYNYDLDKAIYKKKADHNNTIGFFRPDQIISAPNNNPELPVIDNISKEKSILNEKYVESKKNKLLDHTKNIYNEFKFSKDNLRYLRYDPKKLNEHHQLVFNDFPSGNNVKGNLE